MTLGIVWDWFMAGVTVLTIVLLIQGVISALIARRKEDNSRVESSS